MTVSANLAQPRDKTIYNFKHKASGRTGRFVAFSVHGLQNEGHTENWNGFRVEGLTMPNAYDKVNKDRTGLLFTNSYIATFVADGNSPDAAKAAEFVVRAATIELFQRHSTLPTDTQAGEIINVAAQKLLENAKREGWNAGSTLSMTITAASGEYRYAKIGDSPIYVIDADKPKQLGEPEQIIIGTDRINVRGLTAHAYFENDRQMATGLTTDFHAREWVETGSGIIAPKGGLLTVSDGLTKNMPVIIDNRGKVVDSSREEDIREQILAAGGRLSSTLLQLYKKSIERFKDPELIGGNVVIRGDKAHRLASDDKTGTLISRE
ncbi:MAG: hypothetical protein ACP5N9_03980 [Candidatus Bilamarchaeum sp.]|jgi:serine/threonine protein phosphatase PrpC